MNKVQVEIDDEKSMSRTRNETLDQRITEKPLGFIKYHLHEKLHIPLKSIKLERQKQIVKITQGKTRIVAKPGGDEADYGLTLMGEALEVKNEMQASMATWLTKINKTE